MRLFLACLAPCILACSTTPSLDDARWEALDTQSDASLRGVCALADGVVWASGSGGTVLKSLDGGASWERFQVGVAGEGASDYRDIEALDTELGRALDGLGSSLAQTNVIFLGDNGSTPIGVRLLRSRRMCCLT